jgi:hypothetical protein
MGRLVRCDCQMGAPIFRIAGDELSGASVGFVAAPACRKVDGAEH